MEVRYLTSFHSSQLFGRNLLAMRVGLDLISPGIWGRDVGSKSALLDIAIKDFMVDVYGL